MHRATRCMNELPNVEPGQLWISRCDRLYVVLYYEAGVDMWLCQDIKYRNAAWCTFETVGWRRIA